MSLDVVRTRPKVCPPAERQLGAAIFAALFLGVFLALGGAAVWGGVRYRAWGSLLLGLGLVAMGVWAVAILGEELREKAALKRTRQAWLARAVARQATILARSETYNEYGETREEAWEHRLTLALAEPPGATVELLVSERVYDAVAKQGTVTLYCDPADPLTFLVEGE
jgi:hypothetical protein